MSFGRAELFGGFVEFRKRSACVLPIEIYDARFLRLAQTCCIEAGVRLDAKTLRGEELAGHFSHEQLLGIALASNDKRLRKGGDGRLNGENCDKGAREDGAPGPSAPCPHGRDRSRRAWGLTEGPPPYICRQTSSPTQLGAPPIDEGGVDIGQAAADHRALFQGGEPA